MNITTLFRPSKSTSIECHGNDLDKTLCEIRVKGGVVESLDAMVGGRPAQYRVNYFERAGSLDRNLNVARAEKPSCGETPVTLEN